jgi:hypothetical protein
MLCPYLNRLVSQSWNTSNGIAQKCKLRGSWTSYTTPIVKRFYSEPDAIEYGKTLIAIGSIQNLTWSSMTDSIRKCSIQNLMQLSTTRVDSRNMTSFLVLTHERVRYCKGLTKRTLCGIVLFKLNTFLVMFLRVPSIDSTCFLHT